MSLIASNLVPDFLIGAFSTSASLSFISSWLFVLKNYNITAKTGKVAGCRVVQDTDDVMLIENGGVIIRVPANTINVYKRDVQGVIMMRIEEGNALVSIERVPQEEENEN